MSTVAADANPVAAAPRVGADLCAARLRLGWSLEAVAAALRIRLPFLEALEEGRIADLPGNAYAIGFLRTYATTLGLDPDELTRRFRAEAAEVNQLTELSFPAPVPSRGVPAGAVVLLGVVLAIGAYVGWYRLSGNGELPPEVVPPVPTRLASLAERVGPPGNVTQSSSTVSQSAQTSVAPPGAARMAASAPSAAGPAAGAGPATGAGAMPATAGTGSPLGSSAGSPGRSIAGTASGTAPVQSPEVASTTAAPGQANPAAANPPAANMAANDTAAPVEPAPSSVPPTQAAAATTMPPAAAAPAPPAIPQSRIVLSATADAWMEVRDKSGQVLLNRVLHPGEFWAVPPQPNLLLTLGNAGGTDILVDGVSIPSLGASGAVRHDIPLDPDLLKTGKIPSASLPMTTASSTGPAVPAAPRTGAVAGPQ